MKSEFKSMQQALVRLVESFIEDSAGIYSGWDVFYTTRGPEDLICVPDDIPGVRAYYSHHIVTLSLRCRRPCCQTAPDEMAHELTIFFNLYEKDNELLFRLMLGGLPDHDEASFPRIEGSSEYDLDSFPEIRFAALTIDSVLDAGERILAQVPEWHRFLAADTIDWETRLDMRMS